MKNLRAAGVAAVIILACILAVALYKKGAKQSADTAYSPVLPEGVKTALEGRTRITSTEKGKLSWTMICEGLEFYRPEEKEPGLVKVEGPAATIPLEDGGTARVESRHGVYYQDSEDILMKKGVRADFFREGKKEWTIDGETASYRGGAEDFYVSGLSAVMFPASGGTVNLSGKKARYDTGAGIMYLKKNVDITLNREGKIDWTLSGDTASYREKQDTYHVSNMKATRFDGSGKELIISGRAGSYNAGTEKMTITGSVSVNWKKDVTLETGRLDYDAREKIASTDSRVRIKGDGWSARGKGLWANTGTEKVIIKHDVKMNFERGFSGEELEK
ncbi:MAG: LPS export ABC transporter periplasmic protein LptC [bacterium]